jgi:hypothetical protein
MLDRHRCSTPAAAARPAIETATGSSRIESSAALASGPSQLADQTFRDVSWWLDSSKQLVARRSALVDAAWTTQRKEGSRTR